jgi:peptide chain release factor 2
MRKLLFSFTKKDFRVDFYRASGPGGQNVNKRSTACRITHIESGLSAACQEFRTQSQNKKEAFRKLANLLVERYMPKQEEQRTPSDKVVRTYNESKNYVKDHETGEMFSYKDTIGKKDMSKIIESKLLKIASR